MTRKRRPAEEVSKAATTHSFTVGVDPETQIEKKMEITTHKDGKNFVSSHKGGYVAPKNPSRGMAFYDTGAAHKSLRTFQNIKTQSNLKFECCNQRELTKVLGLSSGQELDRSALNVTSGDL